MLEIQVALCAPFPARRAKETGSALRRRRGDCEGCYRARRGLPTLYYKLSFPTGYPDLRPRAPHVVLTASFLSNGSMVTGVLMMAFSCGAGFGCPVISADKR